MIFILSFAHPPCLYVVDYCCHCLLAFSNEISLCNFHSCSCGLFFSTLRSPVKISCKIGFMVLNSFSLLCCRTFELSFKTEQYAFWIEHSGMQFFFSFQHLKSKVPLLVACSMSAETSVDSLVEFLLQVTYCISLAAAVSPLYLLFWTF